MCMADLPHPQVPRGDVCHAHVHVHVLRACACAWQIYLTPKYLAATFVTVVVPLVFYEFIGKDSGLTLLVFFGVLSCFGRSVSSKWQVASAGGNELLTLLASFGVLSRFGSSVSSKWQVASAGGNELLTLLASFGALSCLGSSVSSKSYV